MRHEINEKVFCSRCKRFMGIITSDGKGPFMDASDCEKKDCPMKPLLARFEPKRFPNGVGNSHSETNRPDRDEEAGGMSIFRRAMEDGN